MPDRPKGAKRRLSQARVHRPLQAGISGNGHEGADSIVVSGGYEDDEDYGNALIYTATAATIQRPSARLLTRTSTGLATLAWPEASLMGFRSSDPRRRW